MGSDFSQSGKNGPSIFPVEDQVGIAFIWAHFGEAYHHAGAFKGNPSPHSELSIEETYRAVIIHWLTLQPDVQYIVNPGGGSRRRNQRVDHPGYGREQGSLDFKPATQPTPAHGRWSSPSPSVRGRRRLCSAFLRAGD